MQQEKPRKGPKRLLGFVVILVLIAAVTVGGTLFALKHVLKGSGGADDAAQSTDLPQVQPADTEDTESDDADLPEKAEEEEPLPDLDARDFYAEIANVGEKTPASESKSVRSEKEVAASFAERGFTGTVQAMDADGTMKTLTGSDDRHPIYTATFVTDDDVVWSLTEINGVLFAEPVSFYEENDLDARYVLSETRFDGL